MSQPVQPKNPLDILQGMINAILIETGKALRSAQKEDGRPSVAATTRLKATIPVTTDHFHHALDDLECEILRAKAVLFRDLDEVRSKRLALENPEPIIEEPEPQAMEIQMYSTSSIPADITQDTSTPIKEELKQADSPEEQASSSSDVPVKQESTQPSNDVKRQNLTPPSSENINGADSKPIGLGIVTDGAVDAPGPATADLQNSSIDSLFGPDDTNADDSALDLDSMDFFTNTNAEVHDQSQTQNNDFDLANFGNSTQDFSMPDLNTTTDANTNNNNNNSNSNDANKPVDDSFVSLGDGGGDNMDLDLDLDMTGAGESLFDDMYFGDDTNNTGGGNMEHGEFDNAFFGLE